MELNLQNFTALQKLVSLWDTKLGLAREHKQACFAKDAKAAVDYYLGPHNFLYSKDGSASAIGFTYNATEDEPFRSPLFQMTFNKVAELVQIFGPILYHRNPSRKITPRKDWKPPELLLTGPQPTTNPQVPPDQSVLSSYLASLRQANQVKQQLQMQDALLQARASLLEDYLNYTPNELGLKEDMRLAIDEALVKGRGCLWTELYTPAGTNHRLVGSFFDSVDHLLVDPDVTRLDDAKWIARKYTMPVWELERMVGLPPGTLKKRAVAESTDAKAYVSTSGGEGNQERKQGKTADLIVCYKIWSKMGLGARLKGQTALPLGSDGTPALGDTTESLGDYVYLVVAPNVPFPLNCPPQLTEKFFGPSGPKNFQQAAQALQMLQAGQAQPLAPGLPPSVPQPPDPALEHLAQELQTLRQAFQWPIPFWADDDWPLTCIDFHPLFNQSWPLNHLKPALGEQNFLDWAYSFLAGHIRNACRDFIAIQKGASEEVKAAITQGRDLSIIEIDSINKKIDEVVQFLQHPRMNADLFPVIQAIERNFEKRTGLSELMYGQQATQDRSAAATQAKSQALQIRPDDMSERVETAATLLARKEGIAARYLIQGRDVAPILGDYAAQFWDQQVFNQDLALICREFDYRIEAGSARKPNQDRDVANTQEGLQVILPILSQWAQATGDLQPLNAFLTAWAKARDFDIEAFVLQPPPPQPPPPPGAQPAAAPASNGKVPVAPGG